MHYASNDAAAKDTVTAITDAGGTAATVRAELGVPGDVDTLLTGLRDALTALGVEPALDILVNNAGIDAPGSIADVGEAAFDHVFAVNVRAPFFLVQRALPLLRDGGRVINVSSGVTRVAFPDAIAYAMTKGAVDVLTRTLAKSLGERDITVNAVLPGVVDTDKNATWLSNVDAVRAVSAETALHRPGVPADVADVVAFLASDDSRWVTAALIDTTGGYRL